MLALAIMAVMAVPEVEVTEPAPDVETTEGLSRFFVSACLDGKAAMPQGYKAVSAAEAAMPRDHTLKNARYYRLAASTPTFLRVADVVGRRGGVTHFCELRARRIDVSSAWPIIAGAVDRRIDPRPTKNMDYYVIDYPAQRYRVSLMDQYILAETIDDRTALQRMKALRYPDRPDVTRRDLPF